MGRAKISRKPEAFFRSEMSMGVVAPCGVRTLKLMELIEPYVSLQSLSSSLPFAGPPVK